MARRYLTEKGFGSLIVNQYASVRVSHKYMYANVTICIQIMITEEYDKTVYFLEKEITENVMQRCQVLQMHFLVKGIIYFIMHFSYKSIDQCRTKCSGSAYQEKFA